MIGRAFKQDRKKSIVSQSVDDLAKYLGFDALERTPAPGMKKHHFSLTLNAGPQEKCVTNFKQMAGQSQLTRLQLFSRRFAQSIQKSMTLMDRRQPSGERRTDANLSRHIYLQDRFKSTGFISHPGNSPITSRQPVKNQTAILKGPAEQLAETAPIYRHPSINDAAIPQELTDLMTGTEHVLVTWKFPSEAVDSR